MDHWKLFQWNNLILLHDTSEVELFKLHFLNIENICLKNLIGEILHGEKKNPFWILKVSVLGFPGGAVVKNLPANAGHTGSSPGLGRFHMPRSN